MRNFLLILISIFILVVGCRVRPPVYDAGYIYWYGPTLLEASPWSAVISGNINSVDPAVKDEKGTFYGGEIEIKSVIFSSPTKDVKAFSSNVLKCNGGFSGLSKGDKVLVFLIEYEGDHAIPEYQGSSCNLGVKLKSFNDPIIEAARRTAMNGFIDQKDHSIWKIHDPKGLKHRLQMQEFHEMPNDPFDIKR